MKIVQQCNSAAEQQFLKKSQSVKQKSDLWSLFMLLRYCSFALLNYYRT